MKKKAILSLAEEWYARGNAMQQLAIGPLPEGCVRKVINCAEVFIGNKHIRFHDDGKAYFVE